MTYVFPPSLQPLRDYLKGQGADTRAFVSARQAAFMAQQLLGTRVKFPDQGADMTSTLFLTQKAVTERGAKINPDPFKKPAKGKRRGTRSAYANLKRDKPDFSPQVFAEGVHIFCDGASIPNPGLGGWGVVVYIDAFEVGSAFGGDPTTTNNQMELMAARIVAEFKQHGDTQGGIMLAKAAAWADNDAREAFRVAVVRDVDRIIVTPGQDKPLWMSTELGKTVGQFKTFGVASMQRILLSGMQQRDAATLNGVMVSMALGATAYWAKQTAAGRDLSDNPAVWAVEAFDKSGMAGWLMDANNIAEKASRGRVGLSALTGEQVSRYASRNVTGAFLGPTPEAVADIFQISGSIFARDTTKADLKRLRQMVPLQNVFYLRSLFNQLEQDAGNALNLPEKSQ